MNLSKNSNNYDIDIILKDMAVQINNLFGILIHLRSNIKNLVERNVLTYEELSEKIENIEQRLEKTPDFNNRINVNENISIEENHYFGNHRISPRLMKMEKITSNYVIFSEKDSESLGDGKTIKMSIPEFKESFTRKGEN